MTLKAIKLLLWMAIHLIISVCCLAEARQAIDENGLFNLPPGAECKNARINRDGICMHHKSCKTKGYALDDLGDCSGEGEDRFICCPVNKGYISAMKCEENFMKTRPGCSETPLSPRLRGSHIMRIGFFDLKHVQLFCDGSLISDKIIITAAHCKTKGIKVNVVRIQTDDYYVDEFISHPDYDSTTKHNDIALIKLATPISGFGIYIFPVCLNQSHVTFGTVLNSFGYNDTSFELTSIKTQECSEKIAEEKMINLSQICVKELLNNTATNSSYPSGISLQTNCLDPWGYSTLVGVFSYGNSRDSNSPELIYSRVSAYLDWIEETAWPEEFEREDSCGVICMIRDFFTLETIFAIAMGLCMIIVFLLFSLLMKCLWK